MGHADRQVTRLATRWQIPGCLVDSGDERRGRNWLRPVWELAGDRQELYPRAMADSGKMNARNRPARKGKQQQKKDGIKTNDEMEVTRGVVVGWTVWTRVDVEPNEAKV